MQLADADHVFAGCYLRKPNRIYLLSTSSLLQLRLNKVSELIHKSTNHQNLQQARVSVFFEEIVDTVRSIVYVCTSVRCHWPTCNEPSHLLVQGEETYEKIPNSELVVTRTANRSNTSEYFVNGKKSSFKDVTTLLQAKGVDLNNNRFLILQVGGPAHVWSLSTQLHCIQVMHDA